MKKSAVLNITDLIFFFFFAITMDDVLNQDTIMDKSLSYVFLSNIIATYWSGWVCIVSDSFCSLKL